MDINDPIQSSNLVSDDAAAAMSDSAVNEPQMVQPDLSVNPSSAAPDSTPEPTAPASEPVSRAPEQTPTMPAHEPSPAVSQASSESSQMDDLDSIKKTALDELQPLLKHVEQSPEERYETVMMMIRTNDDASLISQAYEAAKEIGDERTRANALLNIVSEIEYLKSKQNS